MFLIGLVLAFALGFILGYNKAIDDMVKVKIKRK